MEGDLIEGSGDTANLGSEKSSVQFIFGNVRHKIVVVKDNLKVKL